VVSDRESDREKYLAKLTPAQREDFLRDESYWTTYFRTKVAALLHPEGDKRPDPRGRPR
jgi:hypothetical protein